jgi:hypothetical protein
MILLPARQSKAARYVEYDLGLKKMGAADPGGRGRRELTRVLIKRAAITRAPESDADRTAHTGDCTLTVSAASHDG